MIKELFLVYIATVLTFAMLFLAMLVIDCLGETVMDRFNKESRLLSLIIKNHWKEVPYKHFIPAQIEKESLWKWNAELKTSREYGIGLSQITVTSRYNNFLEATKRYNELRNWKWEDRFNINYQLHFVVLQDKSNFTANKKLFNGNLNTWAGALVSYNAGYGTVLNRRALCKVTPGCDYSIWFGGLDSVQLKHEKNLLYGKSLGSRRNDYPHDIIFNKSGTYKCLLV
jgi:hypothetical protein